MNRFSLIVLIVIVFLISGCGEKMIKSKAPLGYVKGELDKLAIVKIESDLETLSESEQKVIFKLVEAGKIIDKLFLLQVDPDNPNIRAELAKMRGEGKEQYLEMFDIMFGSWNRLEHETPFLNFAEKPKVAGFYPKDMTKEEFENYIKKHPEEAKDFEDTFTVIERFGDNLKAVKYHQKYSGLIFKLVQILKEASELSENKSLRKYLKLRAKDLLVDDYFKSDMAWMDLDGNIEVVIGPYEVYEDGLFSYKGAYEAFICIVDQDASEKLSAVSQYLVDMERNLPIPEKYKNYDRGSSSPVKIVQEVFSAGDTKAGIQTTAFNLPNDEKVREAKGSKKVMLKNIAEAKFDKCLIPIANQIIAKEPLENITFDSYFNHILMHEVSHGLGPGKLTLDDGTVTSVSKELKELYPIIEECKADILGLYNLLYMMDKGVFDKKDKYSAFASFLGGMFRSIRFGINEAHGGGVAIQFNYLLENGAFYVENDGKLNVKSDKIELIIEQLANKVLTIQAHGDYDAAKEMVKKYSIMTPLMENIVTSLENIPIDIRPKYEVLKN